MAAQTQNVSPLSFIFDQIDFFVENNIPLSSFENVYEREKGLTVYETDVLFEGTINTDLIETFIITLRKGYEIYSDSSDYYSTDVLEIFLDATPDRHIIKTLAVEIERYTGRVRIYGRLVVYT